MPQMAGLTMMIGPWLDMPMSYSMATKENHGHDQHQAQEPQNKLSIHNVRGEPQNHVTAML